MDEEKDLSSSNELEDTALNDNQTDADVSGDSIDDDTSNIGNGYNGLASSNRQAYANGLTDSYEDRIARNQNALNEARTRANETQKTVNHGKDEEATLEDKNGFDKIKDGANVAKNKYNLLTSKIDKVRSDLFKATHPIEAAKMAAEYKIKMFLLTSIIPIVLGMLAVFLIFVAVLYVLGFFDNESSNSNNNFAYLSSNYSYCESVTMVDNETVTLYSLDEYIAGVVQAESYPDGGEEALKAQAIAARTFVLYNTNGCKQVVTNGQHFQAFNSNPSEAAKKAAADTAGLVLSYNGELFSSQYDSFCYADSDCPDAVKNADGTYTVTYSKLPGEEQHKITLSDSKQYDRIVPGGGHARGMSQLVSYQLAQDGKSYKEILKYFYSNGVDIVNLNSSAGTTNEEAGTGYTSTYTNSKSGKKYNNFKQCGFGYSDICSYGCGLTSAAILVNAYNNNYDPLAFYKIGGIDTGRYIRDYYPNRYESFSSCVWGSNGWCVGTVESSKIGNTNMKQKLISTLSSGGTALLFVNYSLERCLIGGESWTTSQHFFTALDYNSLNNTIYISNPGTNSQSQNGWIPIDNFDCAHVSYLLYPEGS